jgi:hypothetical protein
VFEEAVGGVLALDQPVGVEPLAALVEHDQLAGADVTHQLAVERVDRRALAREHVAVLELPDAERPVALGVAHAQYGVVVHDRKRVRAVDPPHRPLHRADQVGLEQVPRQVVGDHLGVAVAREGVAEVLELAAELVGVDEVAVVAEPERPALERDGERLGARLVEPARGRTADVADTRRAVERLEVPLREGVADQSPLDVTVLLEPVVGDDARRLLAAVLERVQRVVQRQRRVTLGEGDADDAALLRRTARVERSPGVHTDDSASTGKNLA